MKDKMRALEQYSRRTNIEISGLPVTPGENVEEMVKDVGRALGVEAVGEQIAAAHRVPTFRKDRTPSIVVQFVTKVQKDSWMGKYKQKRNFSANEVNPGFPKQRVYINEHLSPDNKQFLAKLKLKCRDLGYSYTWCRDGKFFVRKADGERCIKINNDGDIEKLK